MKQNSLFLVIVSITLMTASIVVNAQEDLNIINVSFCGDNKCLDTDCIPTQHPQGQCVPAHGSVYAKSYCNYGDGGASSTFSTCFHGILTEHDNNCSTQYDFEFSNVSLACNSCFSPTTNVWFNITCDLQNTGDVIFTPTDETTCVNQLAPSASDAAKAVRVSKDQCTKLPSASYFFQLMSSKGGFQAETAAVGTYSDDFCFNYLSYVVAPVGICSDLTITGCPQPTPAPPTTSSTSTTSTTSSTSTTAVPSTTTTTTASMISSTLSPSSSSTSMTSATSQSSSQPSSPSASSSTTSSTTAATAVPSPSTSTTTSTSPTTTTTTAPTPVSSSTSSSSTTAAMMTSSSSTTTITTTATTTTTTTLTPEPLPPTQFLNCTTTGVQFNKTSPLFKPQAIPASTINNMVYYNSVQNRDINVDVLVSPCFYVAPRINGFDLGKCTSGINDKHAAFISVGDVSSGECLLQATALQYGWYAIEAEQFTATYRSIIQRTDVEVTVGCTEDQDSGDQLYAGSSRIGVKSTTSSDGSSWTKWTMVLQSAAACARRNTNPPPPTPPPATTTSPGGNNNNNNNNNGAPDGKNSSPDSKKIAIIAGAGGGALAILVGIVMYFYTKGKRPTPQHFDPSFPDDKALYEQSARSSTSNLAHHGRPSANTANDIEAPLNADDNAHDS